MQNKNKKKREKYKLDEKKFKRINNNQFKQNLTK